MKETDSTYIEMTLLNLVLKPIFHVTSMIFIWRFHCTKPDDKNRASDMYIYHRCRYSYKYNN